jgi:acetyltransferase-like isoleucine patch superfamily enzyme
VHPVVVPTTDVNSETCVITHWHVDDGDAVRVDQVVAEVETSKSVIEVIAPVEGVVGHSAPVGAEVPMGSSIGHVFPDQQALREHVARRSVEEQAGSSAPTSSVRASRKAIELAARHGLDLSTLHKPGLLTVSDVEAAVRRLAPVNPSTLPSPLEVQRAGVERVLVIGAGLGATQVLDILAGDPARSAVGLVDDDVDRWGQEVGGLPVVGGSGRLQELFEGGCFDAAVISISTSVAARTTLRELCCSLGVPLTNAVDATAKIASGVRLGTGNVICAFVHLGVDAQLGDNNFLSAYNSFDHHCVLGSDSSTGPGCMASGLVKIGDAVRMGTGIYIEPHVEIGDRVQIASGVVLRSSVPSDHSVKVRDTGTVVVPTRRL